MDLFEVIPSVPRHEGPMESVRSLINTQRQYKMSIISKLIDIFNDILVQRQLRFSFAGLGIMECFNQLHNFYDREWEYPNIRRFHGGV